MSANNISQLLIRNINLLKSQHVLLINLTADIFIDTFLNTYPESNITSFNSDFQLYNQHKTDSRYHSVFDAVYQTETLHDLVIIQYPKAKAELTFILAMLVNAVTKNANIIIVGEKNSGINSSSKALEEYLQHYQKQDSARHCMLFSGIYIESKAAFNIADWFTEYTITIDSTAIKVAALPGVFSQKKLDIGTKVLLENLPKIGEGKLLDFGCGAGIIGCFVGKKNPAMALTLVDVSALALRSAEKTLALNGLTGQVVATDSMSHIADNFDVVITNPPFHQGLKTNYQATEAFLVGISKHINKQGELIVVANNFLSYRPIMEKSFKKIIDLTNQQGFLVYHCTNK